MSVSEFEKSDLFPLAAKLVSEHPIENVIFQIKSITLQGGRWAYLNASFRESKLVRLGFGWGMIREYGFHELTVPEFEEQLRSYSDWLRSALGPSLRCISGQTYRQQLPWGDIDASTDWRTQLAGIGIRFGALRRRDFIEVSHTAHELGSRLGPNARQYAESLATEALGRGWAPCHFVNGPRVLIVPRATKNRNPLGFCWSIRPASAYSSQHASGCATSLRTSSASLVRSR